MLSFIINSITQCSQSFTETSNKFSALKDNIKQTNKNPTENIQKITNYYIESVNNTFIRIDRLKRNICNINDNFISIKNEANAIFNTEINPIIKSVNLTLKEIDCISNMIWTLDDAWIVLNNKKHYSILRSIFIKLTRSVNQDFDKIIYKFKTIKVLFLKRSLSINEQILLLHSRKLCIKTKNDYLLIKNSLHSIWYYKLNFYFKQFYTLNKWKEVFKNNTNFLDILNFYENESELQKKILKIVLPIENYIKTNISYIIAHEDGLNYGYIKNMNIFFEDNSIESISKIIDKQKTRENNIHIAWFIKNHWNEEKNNIPIWIIVSTLSYWELVKVIDALKPTIISKIIQRFWFLDKDLFMKSLKDIELLRNVSAHNGYLIWKNINYINWQKIMDLSDVDDIIDYINQDFPLKRGY